MLRNNIQADLVHAKCEVYSSVSQHNNTKGIPLLVTHYIIIKQDERVDSELSIRYPFEY